MENINAQLIAEDDVTQESLSALCNRAYIDSHIDEDGDLVVKCEGPTIFLILNEHRKLLKLLCVLGLKEDASLESKYHLVNKMNDAMVIGRFTVHEKRPDTLTIEHFLHYEKGITDFQIITAIRLFSKVIPGAIKEYDTEDLVK